MVAWLTMSDTTMLQQVLARLHEWRLPAVKRDRSVWVGVQDWQVRLATASTVQLAGREFIRHLPCPGTQICLLVTRGLAQGTARALVERKAFDALADEIGVMSNRLFSNPRHAVTRTVYPRDRDPLTFYASVAFEDVVVAFARWRFAVGGPRRVGPNDVRRPEPLPEFSAVPRGVWRDYESVRRESFAAEVVRELRDYGRVGVHSSLVFDDVAKEGTWPDQVRLVRNDLPRSSGTRSSSGSTSTRTGCSARCSSRRR